jgi:nucleoid-associated protein YgaU
MAQSQGEQAGSTMAIREQGGAAAYDPFRGRRYPDSSTPKQTPQYPSRSPYNSGSAASQQAPIRPPRQGSSYSTNVRVISDSDMSVRPAPLDPGAGRRGDGTYEIQPNDSFWSISEKLYGTGAYFQALAEHNRDTVPSQDQLQVGQIIKTPDVAELEQQYAELCPKPEHRYVARHRAASHRVGQYSADAIYKVAEGDTLYRIARYELGNATRWNEIYKLNREVIGEDFNHLRPGTELVLPGKGQPVLQPTDTLTRRPGSIYRR